jgi:hypothetical protein
MIRERLVQRAILCMCLAAVALFFALSYGRAGRGTVRIMPLGDSITYDNRVGDPRPVGLRVAYRQYLWLMLQDGSFNIDFVGSVIAGQDAVPPFDTDNEGHPGWTAGQTATNIYNFLVNHPADVVLLHLGTNGLVASPAGIESILSEIDRFENDYSNPVTVFLALIINRVPYSVTTTQFNVNVQAMAQARRHGERRRHRLPYRHSGCQRRHV